MQDSQEPGPWANADMSFPVYVARGPSSEEEMLLLSPWNPGPDLHVPTAFPEEC